MTGVVIVSADLPRKIPPSLHKSASFKTMQTVAGHARLNGGKYHWPYTHMQKCNNNFLKHWFCPLLQLSQGLFKVLRRNRLRFKEAEEERWPVHWSRLWWSIQQWDPWWCIPEEEPCEATTRTDQATACVMGTQLVSMPLSSAQSYKTVRSLTASCLLNYKSRIP